MTTAAPVLHSGVSRSSPPKRYQQTAATTTSRPHRRHRQFETLIRRRKTDTNRKRLARFYQKIINNSNTRRDNRFIPAVGTQRVICRQDRNFLNLAKLESKIMNKMAELRDQLTARILIAIGINIGAVGLMFTATGFFSG